MNRQLNRQSSTPVDSLDLQHEEYNRSRMFQSNDQKDELLMKNFYKQELDGLLHEKNKQKSLQKQRDIQQRMLYNQRVRLGQQAQKIKQLSYKNYYQMILQNQQNLKSKYVSPFQQRDDLKTKLIDKGVEEGRVRSQIDYQKEVRRQQDVKREFQTVLGHQINHREENQRKGKQDLHRNNQEIRNVLLTPVEIDRIERERKLTEMNKYKEDLDKVKNQKNAFMSQSRLDNPQYSPRNTDKHNLLLNPLPFNIQNPYILKQMQRKNLLNPSNQSNSNNIRSYQQSRRNIFG